MLVDEVRRRLERLETFAARAAAASAILTSPIDFMSSKASDRTVLDGRPRSVTALDRHVMWSTRHSRVFATITSFG